MPTVKPGESRKDFVERCIPVVLGDGTAEGQAQAVAVCSSMWRERGKSLVMKMTKVQRLANGRIRWQARANTGEFDLLQERFDKAFFADVVANFYRVQEALSKGEQPPDGMTEPILDISHYSIYLPSDQRNLARAGWISKMWRDERALFAQGFFDDSRLGHLAAKAAIERPPEDRRVSIVVYPDYARVETESGGRKVYRGGSGLPWMDSLAMTSTPADPGATMEVKSMSTIRDDAAQVLGDDGADVIAELEEARTAKTLPDGAIIKATWTTAFMNDLPDSSFLYIQSGGKKVDGKTEPRSLRHFPVKDASGKIDLPHLRNAIARIPQSNAPGLDKAALQSKARRMLETAEGGEEKKTMDEEVLTDEQEQTDDEQVVEAAVTANELAAQLAELMPQFGAAINERLAPMQAQLDDLAGKTAEFEAKILALTDTQVAQVQKAVNDQSLFDRMWPDTDKLSVQRSVNESVDRSAKGEVSKPEETQPYAKGDVQGAFFGKR